MKRLIFFSLWLVFALACGVLPPLGPTTRVSADKSAPCFVRLPAEFNADCRYITVPESRDPALADDSNEIRLAVVRIRSTNPNPQPDPLIYLDGGPGGHTLEFARFYARDFAPFLADRDVIIFDQRGIGFSEPDFSCPEANQLGYDLLDQDLPYSTVQTLYQDTYFACRERYIAEGVNLYAYTSAENAADVRDIAAAFGYEQVNLFGISYGTRLGLTIMRDHPDIVRSAVLDAVYPPNVDSEAEFLENMDRAFNQLFAGCAQNSACNATYPDLKDVFYDTVDRLNDNPELIEFDDNYTGENRTVLVTGDLLISGLFSMLYSTSEIPYLPGFIYDAQVGIYDGFVDDALFGLFYNQYFSSGMYYTMECYEEVGFIATDAVIASLDGVPPQLAEYYTAGDVANADDYLQFCAEWTDEQRADGIENAAVVSDIPTLVVTGDYDPITPPAWAKLAAETLTNSFYFEFPGVGHSAFYSGECAENMIFSFVNDPTTLPDSSCISRMTGPNFELP